MNSYRVVMKEIQKDGSVRTITRTCCCRDKDEVIRIYGLLDDDIEEYTIEEIKREM